MIRLSREDVIGLIRPSLDAHTLGISSFAQLLSDCGFSARMAPEDACSAACEPEAGYSAPAISGWIRADRIAAIGFSWRLDPEEGASLFARLVASLRSSNLLAGQGGPLRGLFFAGLPEACDLVLERCPFVDGVFRGDETPAETLAVLGIPLGVLPAEAVRGAAYDESRMSFAAHILSDDSYLSIRPVDRSAGARYGQRGESAVARIDHGVRNGLPPLMRAHVGPYLPDRSEAVELFVAWTKRLAASGFLDVLSIGTSQLSQSRFGENWGDAPDGGGVPIATPDEYERIWKAARPMLVRTYAGTNDVPGLARMYEERIDIAWHALSLWWFCAIDGRGPNSVRENLREHEEALRFIAASGKPFEPNVPHHFAFRGADDVTFVVSGFVAAKAAKRAGVRELVLQVMLNTPKATWGVQDLAKARALLCLVRGLEGSDFRVFLQPRGGLDYFRADERKAKHQLAAVTALMDDIEPHDLSSPQIIHVVGWSEAMRLADPDVVDESVRITRFTLDRYRAARRNGEVDDMAADPEVAARTSALIAESRALVKGIESSIRDPYSASGLYRILASGFFPVPRLALLRDEFAAAASWRTRLLNGSVKVVHVDGTPVPIADRIAVCAEHAKKKGGTP